MRVELQNTLSHLPTPNAKRIAIHLQPAAERAAKQGHPWLFESGIAKQNRDGQAGDIAIIFDRKNRFLAVGLYDPHSHIRVKVLQHHTQQTIDTQWFREKLQTAIELREPLLSQNTNGYRVVYGENDGFPGLILDRYDDTLVFKLYSHAWIPYLQNLCSLLLDMLPIERIVLRMSRLLQRNPSLLHGLTDGQILYGEPLNAPIIFQENGLRFYADVINGHKTGFFFDQRENRVYVQTLTKNKTVLDVFSYVGAFSLYAAAGGATEVTSVDISEPAMQTAAMNFALNQDNPNVKNGQHHIVVQDAFEAMEQLYQQGKRYDVVIIDPPSFAKKISEVDSALLSYAKLANLGSRLVAQGGTLVLASCSSRVTESQFFETVERASQYPFVNKVTFQHALDHPIRFPEGAYLKCLVTQLDLS